MSGGKSNYRRLLFMPIVLWTVFSLLNLIYLSIVSERVKTINTLVAMGSAVALITIVYTLLNALLLSRYRAIFRNESELSVASPVLMSAMKRHTMTLYVYIVILFFSAPWIYIVVQALRGQMASVDWGTVAISFFASLSIGIICANMVFAYIRRRQIDQCVQVKIHPPLYKIRYRIILPMMNFIIVLFIIIAVFSFLSVRNNYSPAALSDSLLSLKLKIVQWERETGQMDGAVDSATLMKYLIGENKVGKNFYFFYNDEGRILASSFVDLVDKNIRRDIKEKWNDTMHFHEMTGAAAGSSEAEGPVFFRRMVYYGIIYKIPGLDIHVWTAETSADFWRSTNGSVYFITIFGMAFLIFMTFYFLRIMAKKFEVINTVSAFMGNVAQGKVYVDYTGKHERGDEISMMIDATNIMVTSLRRIGSSLKKAVLDLVEISDHIEQARKKLVDESEETSSTIVEVSASVEEITSSIEQISKSYSIQFEKTKNVYDSIKGFSETMQGVRETTSRADSSARDAYASVVEMEKEIHDSMGIIKEIGESSQRIVEAVNIIKDISDQTNLLALNASIEAARAGDAGRGFAVVADEVSKLADRTSSETKGIESLVTRSNALVEKGIENIMKISESMQGMNESVRSSTELIENISGLSDAFLTKTEMIFSEVGDLNTISEQNSMATREQLEVTGDVTRAITHMNSAIERSIEEVNRFQMVIQGLSDHTKKIEIISNIIKTEQS